MNVEHIQADARDFPPADARGFQALITDPPYSAHVHANITSAGTLGEGSRGWHRQELEFEPLGPALQEHIAAVAARIQGWVLVYADHEGSHGWRRALNAAHAEYVRIVLTEQEPTDLAQAIAGAESWADAGVLPWERWSQPQKSGDRPTQGFECVTLAWGRRGSRKAWNGPGSLTCLRHRAMRGDDKHRTQKPLDQALDLVSWFTNAPHLPWGTHPEFTDERAVATRPVPAASIEGRLCVATPAQSAVLPVLDLCGGAATTAVACALLGRSCLSFELLPRWADVGAQRVERALRGELDDVDAKACERWVASVFERDAGAPMPKAPDGSDVKTWERAQRRIADARYLVERMR